MFRLEAIMTEEFFRTCSRSFSEGLSDGSAAPAEPQVETHQPSLAGVRVSDLLAQYGEQFTQPRRQSLGAPRTPPKAAPLPPPGPLQEQQLRSAAAVDAPGSPLSPGSPSMSPVKEEAEEEEDLDDDSLAVHQVKHAN